MFTSVKTDAEIDAMREGGKMLATVLQGLRARVVPGVSTKALADDARAELQSLGGEPAFLGYQGFPDVLCVSINDEVVHGIPNSQRLIREGDVVGLDFGVSYRGLITDAAVSVACGQVPSKAADTLIKVTEQALMAGIDILSSGSHVGDISAAVQEVLDDSHLGIVRDLVGHGVGHELHEEPNIPNFGMKGQGPVLTAGMTIAIEPMATIGSHEVYVGSDGWTVITSDHSLSAHFEHTVLITENGAEILTST